jgi:copper(I)-binding protein
VVLLLALIVVACAGDRGVKVRDVRAFEALKGGTGAIYATLINPTDSAEQLDSVTSSASPVISAHDSREVDGIVSMVPMDHPTIPAGDSLVFTPGAAHLMLEDLPRDLKAGDSLAVTFWLRHAGARTIMVVVRPYGS